MSFYGADVNLRRVLDDIVARYQYIHLRKKKWELEEAKRYQRAMYDAYLKVVEFLQERGIPAVPIDLGRFRLTMGYALAPVAAMLLMDIYKKDARKVEPLNWINLAAQFLIFHVHKDERMPSFLNLTEEVLSRHPPLDTLKPEDAVRPLVDEMLHTFRKRFGDVYNLPEEERHLLYEYTWRTAQALKEKFETLDAYLRHFYEHVKNNHNYGPEKEQELQEKYERLLKRGWELRNKALEEIKQKLRQPPPEAEFVGVRRPKAEKEVPVPEVKNVGELKEILRRYKEELERKGYPISAHIVGTLLEHIERAPEDVAAVPRGALDRALAHVLTAARVYRILRDEGWYGKLLGVAKKVAMGDRQVLEKLKERLRNLFPVPEEVHPEHPEEVRRAMERIVDVVTRPEVITSLAEKQNPYEYMLSMGKNERLYLGIARDVERIRKTHGEIVPVKEVGRVAGKLAPEVWRRIIKK